jgi:hypothetical protein
MVSLDTLVYISGVIVVLYVGWLGSLWIRYKFKDG